MFRIKNSNEFQRNLERLSKRSQAKMKGAMRAAGSKIMQDAIKRAPHRTGTLRRSNFMALVKNKGNLAVLMGFRANYSAFVHEGHPNPSKRKFLEKAYKQFIIKGYQRFTKRLIDAIKDSV